VEVTTAFGEAAPEEAILNEASRIAADLIVLGVDRLQGATLDFGTMVASVLAQSKAPVLVMSATTKPAARADP
jgi:nucleotide-binding universal stress UspA family protein